MFIQCLILLRTCASIAWVLHPLMLLGPLLPAVTPVTGTDRTVAIYVTQKTYYTSIFELELFLCQMPRHRTFLSLYFEGYHEGICCGSVFASLDNCMVLYRMILTYVEVIVRKVFFSKLFFNLTIEFLWTYLKSSLHSVDLASKVFFFFSNFSEIWGPLENVHFVLKSVLKSVLWLLISFVSCVFRLSRSIWMNEYVWLVPWYHYRWNKVE